MADRLASIVGSWRFVIMMSQNRQEAKDRIRSEHDYQVNLQAELEIEQLQVKLELLRVKQWNELLELQQLEIDLLKRRLYPAHDGGEDPASSGEEGD